LLLHKKEQATRLTTLERERLAVLQYREQLEQLWLWYAGPKCGNAWYTPSAIAKSRDFLGIARHIEDILQNP
jgi:hypothetical protein